jgi:hypothetical protein
LRVKTSVTELPFNTLVGIRPASDSAYLLQLPAGNQYLNHLGTVHAEAQLALAEASCGEFLIKHFGSPDGLMPVVRRVESKFRKPANRNIMSSATAASRSSHSARCGAFIQGPFIHSNYSRDLRRIRCAHTTATFEWFIRCEKKSDRACQPPRNACPAIAYRQKGEAESLAKKASMRTSAPLTGCPAGSFTTPSRADAPAQALNVKRSNPTKLILSDFNIAK